MRRVPGDWAKAKARPAARLWMRWRLREWGKDGAWVEWVEWVAPTEPEQQAKHKKAATNPHAFRFSVFCFGFDLLWIFSFVCFLFRLLASSSSGSLLSFRFIEQFWFQFNASTFNFNLQFWHDNFYVWHNICGIDNANVFQHEIYSFIAGIDSGLPHTYARTHTHTQAHSSRALSLSQHFRPGNCTLRRIRPDCEALSLPVPVNSSGCCCSACCCSALFCAPLLNVLFAGAYSPHFKATRRPLERALEPFALTAQHSSRSLSFSFSGA